MKLSNIFKSYGQSRVLNDVTLAIPNHKLTAFIGPNGAGKSTVLDIMSQYLSFDDGHFTINETPVKDWQHEEFAKHVTIMRQKNDIRVNMTVEEMVSFGRFPYSHGQLTETDWDFIDTAIDYLELEDFRHRNIQELSGGQLQRVYIALVLAQDTEYILLDEPLNNLDLKQSMHIMTILRQMVDDFDKTIVLVIHDLQTAVRYADHIIAFKDGSVFDNGDIEDMCNDNMLSQLYDIPIEVINVKGQKICIQHDEPFCQQLKTKTKFKQPLQPAPAPVMRKVANL